MYTHSQSHGGLLTTVQLYVLVVLQVHVKLTIINTNNYKFE